MSREDGCSRLFGLVLGFGILLVFCLPTAAYAIFASDPLAFVLACALAAVGLLFIVRAIEG